MPFTAFRVLLFVGIDPHSRGTISVPTTGLPLLGFHLLMVSTPASYKSKPLRPSRLAPARYETQLLLRFMDYHFRGRPTCRQTNQPSQGFSPSAAFLVLITARCGLIRLMPIHLGEPCFSQSRAPLFAPSRPSCQSQESQSSRRIT
jgi:hypothetical protein